MIKNLSVDTRYFASIDDAEKRLLLVKWKVKARIKKINREKVLELVGQDINLYLMLAAMISFIEMNCFKTHDKFLYKFAAFLTGTILVIGVSHNLYYYNFMTNSKELKEEKLELREINKQLRKIKKIKKEM